MTTVTNNQWSSIVESAMPALYRVAAYFALTLLDDPAMLALAFC
jgi:hypothetical protein